MFKIAKPFFIHTITSLHAGSGDSLGIVDLPIQREKHTSFPKIESSSLKGSLREAFENNKEENVNRILLNNFKENGKTNPQEDKNKGRDDYNHAIHLTFGYDDDGIDDNMKKKFEGNSEFSGCLAFTDARLLLFPVKSMKGVFAWITCPYILERFKEDTNLTKKDDEVKIDFIKPTITVVEGSCIVSDLNIVSIETKKDENKDEKKQDSNKDNSKEQSKKDIIIKNVILEEYSFTAKPQDEKNSENLKKIIKSISDYTSLNNVGERIVILSDDDFKDFVNLSTEVITRTKINNATGTVAQGALFNEEYLPPETIMYYLVFASPVFQKEEKKGIFQNKNGKDEEEIVFEFFEKGLPEFVQIGGNATIGKGITRMMFDKIKNAKEEKKDA